MTSHRGRLLVAAPSLIDPNFRQTVVLVLEHTDEGALGVVLNRPSELPVSSVAADWSELVVAPTRVFIGGPVESSALIALGEVAEGAGLTEHWTPIVGRIGSVDLDAAPGEIPALERMRVFAGYAGWAPGQLEGEIAEKAWFVLEVERDDVFSPDAPELWWEVLGRQPGPLGRLRHHPREAWHN